MKDDRTNNSLKSARKFRRLGAGQIRRRDRVSQENQNDLFSFSFSDPQVLSLQIQRRSRNSKLGIQLFALKQTKNVTLKAIGQNDFSDLTSKEIKKFFMPIATLRLNNGRKYLRQLRLDQGDYYIRVFHRQGEVSRYQLDLSAQPILPSPATPLPSRPTDQPANSPIPTPSPAPLTPVSTPIPAPVPIPVPAPLPILAPAPAPLPNPSPAPTPLPAPIPIPVPTPAPAPIPIPNPSPNPAPAPSPNPTPIPSPIPAPSPAPSPNQAPVVSAGNDSEVALLPWASIALSGSAVDPNSDPLKLKWEQISGPGDAIFENRSDSQSRVQFSMPGTYVLRLTANDSTFQTADEVTVTVSRPTARIMPIGDSITQADKNHSSYRRPLWQMLQAGEYTVDFVGSLQQNFDGANPNSDFDLDHEGHWGWRADEILANLNGWASTYQPHVALIHLGTNDIFQGNSNASTISELEQIIGVLRANNPNVAILLAQIIPYQGNGSELTDLNQRIAALAARQNRVESPIILVNQRAGFDAATDTYDGVHPNATGEQKMANRWYETVERLFQGNGDPVKRNQIDALTGTPGVNTFVLGAWGMSYYDDGLINTQGLTDYAVIKNFEVGLDRVQLFGSPQDYVLGASPVSGISGTGIFIDKDGNGGLGSNDELIGIVENRTGLNLNNINQFIYA
jgi:lysophospholipase L1-like esterase